MNNGSAYTFCRHVPVYCNVRATIDIAIHTGESIVFDTDYLGSKRGGKVLPGPINSLKPGFNRIRIW